MNNNAQLFPVSVGCTLLNECTHHQVIPTPSQTKTENNIAKPIAVYANEHTKLPTTRSNQRIPGNGWTNFKNDGQLFQKHFRISPSPPPLPPKVTTKLNMETARGNPQIRNSKQNLKCLNLNAPSTRNHVQYIVNPVHTSNEKTHSVQRNRVAGNTVLSGAKGISKPGQFIMVRSFHDTWCLRYFIRTHTRVVWSI